MFPTRVISTPWGLVSGTELQRPPCTTPRNCDKRSDMSPMKTTHALQMSAMSVAALPLLLLTFVCVDSHGTLQYLVHDPKSAKELCGAIDAAIMIVLLKSKWFTNLWNSHQYVQAHLVTSCSPSPSKWQWPDRASATGLLKRVFDSNELKVAGVQWASQIVDYTTDGILGRLFAGHR